jgi:hypothetical protein
VGWGGCLYAFWEAKGLGVENYARSTSCFGQTKLQRAFYLPSKDSLPVRKAEVEVIELKYIILLCLLCQSHLCIRGSRSPMSKMSNRLPQWEDEAGLDRLPTLVLH